MVRKTVVTYLSDISLIVYEVVNYNIKIYRNLKGVKYEIFTHHYQPA